MSYRNWLNYLSSAEKSSVINGRIRKIHYKFPDGQQMAEEYSMDTGVLQKRGWRKPQQLLGESEWEVEVGEDYRQLGCTGDADKIPNTDHNFTVKISNTEPTLIYQVLADSTKKAIVVKTTNKKYYKVIKVQELDRCELLPSQANISTHHQYNTLIITYRKPDVVCEMEAEVLLLLKDIETETDMGELLQGLLKK
uniref:Protein DPCD n=1 Tax=Glossina brevipalpis TaxID=37001 RepID=A0A1A9W7N5_9MUSC